MELSKLLTEIQTGYDKLNSKYQELKERQCPGIMPVKNINKTGSLVMAFYKFRSSSSWDKVLPQFQCSDLGYNTFQNIYSQVSKLDSCLAAAQVDVNKIRAEVEKLHAENLPALENNQRVFEIVENFMRDVGIPATYSSMELKTPRSKTKTSITRRSGWNEDLIRTCVRNDGYAQQMKALDDYEASLIKHHKFFVAQATRHEAQLKREEDKKRLERGINIIAAKYLPADQLDFEPDDILSAICKKDKYLDLAWAMEQTRNDWNDWNDGFYWVRNAIDRFVVDTKEDQDIEDEIMEILNSEESDGRVFRDCEYSYDTLYSMVDSEVVSDFRKVQEYKNM